MTSLDGLPQRDAVQLGQPVVHGLADLIVAEIEKHRLADKRIEGLPQPPPALGLAVDLPPLGHEEALGLQ